MHGRYHAEYGETGRSWAIVDDSRGEPVELVRSSAVAAHDVDLLNAGRAHIDPHAIVGNRVVLNLGTWS